MAEICRGVVTESDGSSRMELRRDRVEPGVNPVPLALALDVQPKFGVTSICGRRRKMEDAVAIHPFLCRREDAAAGALHYYGVYDGHGCKHVPTRCKERLHELVEEELLLDGGGGEICRWQNVMERSFSRMDKEIIVWNDRNVLANTRICRCKLQMPQCDAVGSMAVVGIVTPQKIIVANCGDSRAVLCRGGEAIPLSTCHKLDRPNEPKKIQEAGVFDMTGAIGDNYLKSYLSFEPEVTVMEQREEDECLILGTHGLWAVVSNEMACGGAKMCLLKGGDKACCDDAALFLTKLVTRPAAMMRRCS